MSNILPSLKSMLRLLTAVLFFGFGLQITTTNLVADVILSETFTESTLPSEWQVLPGRGDYSLVGDLRYFNQGPLSSPSGWSTTSNALAFQFSGTDWQANIVAAYSLDWLSSGSYTGPSVPTQAGSSGAQRPQVIMSFSPVTANDRSALAGTNYADFDRGIDAWYGDNHLTASSGGTTSTNLLNPADSAIHNNIAGGTYWYQFVRNGGDLTMKVSYDGINYSTVLTTTLADPSSSYNELLLTGSTFQTTDSFTDYKSVVIQTTDAPEPPLLIPVGLALVLFARKRFNITRRGIESKNSAMFDSTET